MAFKSIPLLSICLKVPEQRRLHADKDAAHWFFLSSSTICGSASTGSRAPVESCHYDTTRAGKLVEGSVRQAPF
jgi:hypothetical protein